MLTSDLAGQPTATNHTALLADGHIIASDDNTTWSLVQSIRFLASQAEVEAVPCDMSVLVGRLLTCRTAQRTGIIADDEDVSLL